MEGIKLYQDMKPQELSRTLQDAKDRLHELRFQIASNQLKNVREVRKVRTAIAQINTVLSERKNTKSE